MRKPYNIPITSVFFCNSLYVIFLHNDELNAVVLGGDFGNQMRAMFEVNLEGSQETGSTGCDAGRRPPPPRPSTPR